MMMAAVAFRATLRRWRERRLAISAATSDEEGTAWMVLRLSGRGVLSRRQGRMGIWAIRANLISAWTQPEASAEADQQRTRRRAFLMEWPSWAAQVSPARRLAESKKTLRRSDSQDCLSCPTVTRSWCE